MAVDNVKATTQPLMIMSLKDFIASDFRCPACFWDRFLMEYCAGQPVGTLEVKCDRCGFGCPNVLPANTFNDAVIDAPFIVRACNAHYGLVAACRKSVATLCLVYDAEGGEEIIEVIGYLRAAITKATERV